jgi:hypothetical protein
VAGEIAGGRAEFGYQILFRLEGSTACKIKQHQLQSSPRSASVNFSFDDPAAVRDTPEAK